MLRVGKYSLRPTYLDRSVTKITVTGCAYGAGKKKSLEVKGIMYAGAVQWGFESICGGWGLFAELTSREWRFGMRREWECEWEH